MEAIVKIVYGCSVDQETTRNCVFCSGPAKELFGISMGKKPDGLVMRFFPVCETHKAKINMIVSGDYDLDLINLPTPKATSSGKIRFRS